MIRRTIVLMAGARCCGALLTAHRTCRRTRQENRRRNCRAFRRSFRSRSPMSPKNRAFSKSMASTSKSAIRQRHRRGARSGRRRRRHGWSPTPPVINQVSNADVPLVARLRHAESGLGHRHRAKPARPARIWPARTSASIRSTARARWRCARCSPPAARA